MKKYEQTTADLLSRVQINNPAFYCEHKKCCDPMHISAINNLHRDITHKLLEASANITCNDRNRPKQVIGWNEMCKEVHY